MEKKWKKLTLHRETLCSLRGVRSGVVEAWVKTIDATFCVSNCPPCRLTG